MCICIIHTVIYCKIGIECVWEICEETAHYNNTLALHKREKNMKSKIHSTYQSKTARQ